MGKIDTGPDLKRSPLTETTPYSPGGTGLQEWEPVGASGSQKPQSSGVDQGEKRGKIHEIRSLEADFKLRN